MKKNDRKELLLESALYPETVARPSAGTVLDREIPGSQMRLPPLGSDTEKSLNDYLKVVIERKRLVVIIFLACLIAAAIYAIMAAPTFTSSALIEIEERKPATNEKMINNESYGEITRYLETQTGVLRSRGLAESLVRKMDLAESPEFTRKATSPVAKVWSRLRSTLRQNESMPTDAPKAREDRAVRWVMKRVKVDPVRKSNLIQVSMEAGNPVAAQHMLLNYLTLFLEQNLDKRRQECLAGAQWLKTEMEKTENKLREAQAALVRFVVDKKIVDSADGGIGQALKMVDKTMDVHLKSQQQRERLEALKNQQSGQPTMLTGEMKSQLIDKLKAELATLESEYSQMKGVYSTSYPKMRVTSKRIRFFRQRIKELEKVMVDTALNVAKAREKLFKETYENSKAEADRVKGMEGQYFLLKGNVDTAGEFLKILSREYKATEIKARTIANNARLVDQPSLPSRPSKPDGILIIGLGAVLGLFGGLLGAFVRELSDQTVRKPTDAKLFHIENLGVVPNLKKFPGVKRSVARNVPIELVARHLPRSVASDAMKNIETSIFLSTLDQSVTSLAVVSATPGEGKSLFAVSLASVLSGTSGKRAVLVDGDMRKPRVHEVFSLRPGAPGLTDLLRDSEISLNKVINDTAIRGLFVVPAGTGTTDPVSLLRGDRMTKLMDQLKEQFDYVVIDTPPILGFVDARLICCYVDGALLVTMQGRVSREEVSFAVDALNSGRTTKILGMILNKVNTGPAGYFGHGFSSRHYRSYKQYYEEPRR